MNIVKQIPNTITCGNLFCGCLAIVKAFEGDLVWASYLVGIAAVLDFLDGFAARMLKAYSPIGKDLDSLADMVTFGVVPGILMFRIIQTAHVWDTMFDAGPPDPSALAMEGSTYLTPYFAFIITIFSCIRLAKFNNDPRQSDSFIGLPTPANTILIASFPLILEFNPELASWFISPWFFCGLSLILSLLLISEIPLFSLKFKNFTWTDNAIRYVFLLVSLILLGILGFPGVPLVIALYVLMSIGNNRLKKMKAV
jgi:CDP-diacylglycerol--serine O-phosphatidyltransferase